MSDHLIVRARWVILAVLLAVCAWILPGATQVREDDDVLAFLPGDHADVVAFREIADRFGVLEIALVGLHHADGDMLTLDRVDAVRALSQQLGDLAGVRMVLSFTDLPDPQVTDEGLEVAALVPSSLRDPQRIREKVLGSTDAVGNLISSDGKAAVLMVFLTSSGASTVPRSETLGQIREVVATGWTGEAHVGGGPFVEDAAAQVSRGDVRRLSPIVIGVLVLVSAVLLGSITAAGLNLVLTALGVGLVLGAHGVFGEPLTLVSSSLPVMMVALGGAFGVHILAGFQRQDGASNRTRVSATLRELWRPVVLSGVTTSVAFFALMVMPQVPMQRFGMIAGLGVLLLLALALLVLPALLAVLPGKLLPPRPERAMPLKVRPPLWVLLLVAVVGAGLATRLEADADMTAVFSPDSEPIRSNNFFNDHFGGSTYLQIAVEAAHETPVEGRKPMAEPGVLRALRDVAEAVRKIPGVVDVRTVVEPMELLNEALGGRRGIPETQARAGRILTYLQGHPAVAQLLTHDAAGALVHVKLAPLSGAEQTQVTHQVREVLDRYTGAGRLRIAPTSDAEVREVQLADVSAHLARALGKSVDAAELVNPPVKAASPALLAAVREVRDRALDSDDSPVEGVPREEIDALDPASLLAPRGEALAALLREKLPTLVANDPEGIVPVAEHLGPWTDEVLARFRVEQRCDALGLPHQPAASGGPSCAPALAALSELDDEEWAVFGAGAGRGLDLRMRLTGQPVIGMAFAESETRSLLDSTLVSLAGLALTLLVARQFRALVPAMWTLCVTMGLLALFRLPISIGTSMISCIAMGAGVDFAIHLGVRAERFSGPARGQRAVEEIGVVTLISALQLACAFAVLLASEMVPLREFGIGLALGLVGAALGACWLVPWLYRGRNV